MPPVGAARVGVYGGVDAIPDSAVDTFDEVFYEDNGLSLSDYYNGDLGQFTRQTSTVQSGSHALHANQPGSNFQMVSEPGEQNSDLNTYPQPDDTFEVWMRYDSTNDPFFWFDFASNGNSYQLNDGYQVWCVVDSRIELQKLSNSSGTSLASQSVDYAGNGFDGNWFRVEVSWSSNGDIAIDLYNPSGTNIASISANDTSYTRKGFGFGGLDGADVFWDSVSIL